MQKISFLLLGTSLSFLPQTLNAQCISPLQDCYALGYTQTSCSNGKGVKCPFGSGWYCGGTAAQDCIKLGYDKDCTAAGESGSGQTCNGKYQSCTCDSSYQYTCSGTGYSGGSGTACNGKYTSCTCTSGYEWKDGACSKDYSTCKIGTLFYSDGSCSVDKLNSKILLGVVIMEKTANTNGWIMTITPIQNSIEWNKNGANVPALKDCDQISCLTDIQDSCINTDIITAYGDSSTYPAAWAAKNYKPNGTPNNKYWCLPSGGLLNTINNSSIVSKINTGITTAGGTKLGYGGQPSRTYEYLWTSSETPGDYAWYLLTDINDTYDIRYCGKGFCDYGRVVRPVMSF